jgi:hypothetical protein
MSSAVETTKKKMLFKNSEALTHSSHETPQEPFFFFENKG